MPSTDQRAHPHEATTDALRAAFRELHGPHLHGFALLMTLGDAAHAARLAADALNAGVDRAAELRHPERAAAWLRARIVRNASGVPPVGPRPAQRLQLLAELGADAAVVAGLAALRREERGALIASAVERLDGRDVATIVGRHGPSLERLLAAARRRFTAAHRSAVTDPAPPGPLVERIRELAARAIS